jgi:hypothetical protein
VHCNYSQVADRFTYRDLLILQGREFLQRLKLSCAISLLLPVTVLLAGIDCVGELITGQRRDWHIGGEHD